MIRSFVLLTLLTTSFPVASQVAASPTWSGDETPPGPQGADAVGGNAARERTGPLNTLSVEGGGMSLLAGAQYERTLSRRVRVSAGYSQFTTGDRTDLRVRLVPVGISVVQPLRGRLRADAGLGVVLGRTVEHFEPDPLYGIPEGSVPNDRVRYRALPSVNVGLRFEGRRVYGRTGASVIVVPPRDFQPWTVLPWPSVGVGVRF